MANLSEEIVCCERAINRGYFTPDEDEIIRHRFAQYLGARAALLQTIAELDPIAQSGELSSVDEYTQLRAFTIGYTAVCLLVRAAHTLITELAHHKFVQRKLNEAEPTFGIPRKQYTAVYRSLTSPRNALRIRQLRHLAEKRRTEIDALADDPLLAPVLEHLRDAEPFVYRRFREYARSRLAYRWHSWRRRRASAMQQALATMMELGGRVIADIHSPLATPRLADTQRAEIEAFLEPGDVLVSRHDTAFSNLFLPGYWPHTALHIGSAESRAALNVDVDDQRAQRWVDPIQVLEARKDGVLFRPLSDTLAVDSIAVLRPKVDQETIGKAISRAVKHEGKLYDFEFDFFRSDCMVCTEVVYRAYHGLGGIEFDLSERAGKSVLTAEDIVTVALQRRGLEPVLVFGLDWGDDTIYTGNDVMSKMSELRARMQGSSGD